MKDEKIKKAREFRRKLAVLFHDKSNDSVLELGQCFKRILRNGDIITNEFLSDLSEQQYEDLMIDFIGGKTEINEDNYDYGELSMVLSDFIFYCCGFLGSIGKV